MPLAVELSGLLGVLLVLMGAWGFVSPSGLTGLVERFGSRGGLWAAVAIRLVLGAALWFAAAESRAPMLLKALGVIAIVAAVALPLLGTDRFKALVERWSSVGPSAKRAWSLVAIAFGVAILWALLPSAS